MKKIDLIRATAERTGQSQAVVRQVLDGAADVAMAVVAAAGDVFLFGLGKLEVAQRGAKKARDIRRGTSVIVPPRRVVLFKPSEALVAAANADS